MKKVIKTVATELGKCTRTGGEEKTIWHDYSNGVCNECYSIEMVQIPAGTFTRGSSHRADWSAQPPHQVTLTSGFKIGKYQITQELYQAVMGINPSWFHGGSGREPKAGEVQNRRPVESVTWFDVVKFCNKLSEREGLTPVYTITGRTPAVAGYPITAVTVTADWSNNGYRLPTEAEWEYACRAGTTTAWHFGDNESELENYAWYWDNSNSRTHQVGLKLPNAYGLYDMHGNVWEWCWDWRGSYSSGAQTDPRGAGSGASRVGRGGSWYDSAGYSRSAYRGSDYPYYRDSSIGLRLVRP